MEDLPPTMAGMGVGGRFRRTAADGGKAVQETSCCWNMVTRFVLGELFRAEEQGELTGRGEDPGGGTEESPSPFPAGSAGESDAAGGGRSGEGVQGRGGSRITRPGRKAWEDLQVRKPV